MLHPTQELEPPANPARFKLPQSLQLLRVQGMPPVLAQKLRYYADPEFRDLFMPEAGR